MGAEANANDSVGMNAAHYAAANGSQEGLKWLVEHGVDVNAVADNGYSVLDIAVLANNQGNAEYLKSLGVKFHLWRYDELLSATQKGSTGEVRNLLAAGVNPNCQSKDYPAHIAARNGDVTTLEWLLKGGADPSRTNAAGLTPFEEALKSGSAGSAIVLLENGCEVKDAWLPELLEVWSQAGVKSSWEELIRRYLDKTVQKDLTGGAQNLTALQYAAWAGSPEMVNLLLKAGASATTRDDKGWTALHWNSVGLGEVVADAKRVEVAEALLRAGAKVTDETEKPRKRQEEGKPAEFHPPKATALDVLDNSLAVMPQLEAFLSQRNTPRNLTLGDYLAIGNEHLNAKEYALAIRDFSRAVNANPNAAESYIGRAKALQAQKLHNEAQRDLAIAVKKAPQNAEAWYLLSVSQFELKNNKEAYKSAKTAVDIDPSLMDAYWYKGQAALANGDKVEACNSLADGANKGSDRCRKSYEIHCQR
jgi:ankyrin repeat protein